MGEGAAEYLCELSVAERAADWWVAVKWQSRLACRVKFGQLAVISLQVRQRRRTVHRNSEATVYACITLMAEAKAKRGYLHYKTKKASTLSYAFSLCVSRSSAQSTNPSGLHNFARELPHERNTSVTLPTTLLAHLTLTLTLTLLLLLLLLLLALLLALLSTNLSTQLIIPTLHATTKAHIALKVS